MKYLKHFLPKGTLLDTTILLTAIFFIEITNIKYNTFLLHLFY